MIKTNKFFIYPTSSLNDAIIVIDEGAYQVALVVDSDNKLVGIITDGDVRRAILKGLSLDTCVSSIMTDNPTFVREGVKKDDVVELMRKNSIHHVPVLDSGSKVVDLIVLDDLLTKPSFPNPVVIMAGGRGERLKPLTNNCPKPMLRVNGVPMLEIILKKCRDAGFKNFYISVNYLSEQIINYFSDGTKWGVSIKYLKEKEFLGTCGCLNLLPDNFSDDFIVINGDIFTDLDLDRLIRFHLKTENLITVCSRAHRVRIPFAVLNSTGNTLQSFTEKPMYEYQVNAGVYALKKECISDIPSHFFNMTDLLEKILEKGKIIGVFPIHENWKDIGNPTEFAEVCSDLKPL